MIVIIAVLLMIIVHDMLILELLSLRHRTCGDLLHMILILLLLQLIL